MRLFAFLVMLCGLMSTYIEAQPVLPADVPLGLDAMRVVILVNGDGTQSIITDWEYDMYPPQAVMSIWLIPVPSEPTSIELLPLGALDALENSTRKRFDEPDNPCPYTGDRGIPGYDYRNVNITEAVYVRGEYILERVDEWLAKGFWVDIEALHQNDIPVGFVALTVPLYGNEEGAVSPVKLTYLSQTPTLYSLYGTAHTLIWIFGDMQYIPENYPNPTLNYEAFSTTGEIATNFYAWNYVQGRVTSTAYDRALGGLSVNYNDFFVTEYATPTTAINSNNDPLLTEWVANFSYMTRFRANFGLPDPVFMPASDMPDVARDVNLGEYVEPAVFWGCPSD